MPTGYLSTETAAALVHSGAKPYPLWQVFGPLPHKHKAGETSQVYNEESEPPNIDTSKAELLELFEYLPAGRYELKAWQKPKGHNAGITVLFEVDKPETAAPSVGASGDSAAILALTEQLQQLREEMRAKDEQQKWEGLKKERDEWKAKATNIGAVVQAVLEPIAAQMLSGALGTAGGGPAAVGGPPLPEEMLRPTPPPRSAEPEAVGSVNVDLTEAEGQRLTRALERAMQKHGAGAIDKIELL